MKNILAFSVFTFITLAVTATPVHANPITISKSEIRAVVGAFPSLNTKEESLDDDMLLQYQDTRTSAECAAAAAQSNNESLTSFFGGKDGPLSASEIKYLNVRLLRVKAIAAANATIAKKMYNRPRPYKRNSAIKPCIELESSLSYPSGHTTLARLYARVLSLRYPSRAAAFMKSSDQVAKNRVLGGVHHPSDIEAGNRLADYLANKFYK